MNSGYYNSGNKGKQKVQKSEHISYSQNKRNQMDYRSEYFKHNPGLFGCIWKCAYCGRPLFGRHAVQVDHIVPLNNPLGQNKGYNLVAACAKCNREKSDKLDYRAGVGYMSKIFDSLIFGFQKLFVICFAGVWTFGQMLLSNLMSLLILPFKKTSLVTKIVFAIIYLGVFYWIYSSLFGGF